MAFRFRRGSLLFIVAVDLRSVMRLDRKFLLVVSTRNNAVRHYN